MNRRPHPKKPRYKVGIDVARKGSETTAVVVLKRDPTTNRCTIVEYSIAKGR